MDCFCTQNSSFYQQPMHSNQLDTNILFETKVKVSLFNNYINRKIRAYWIGVGPSCSYKTQDGIPFVCAWADLPPGETSPEKAMVTKEVKGWLNTILLYNYYDKNFYGYDPIITENIISPPLYVTQIERNSTKLPGFLYSGTCLLTKVFPLIPVIGKYMKDLGFACTR